ncbi:MAG: hypothetical protein E7095_02800 [Bacteroides sp.]|nr:hypothetical protein [Bacteroides sp.]
MKRLLHICLKWLGLLCMPWIILIILACLTDFTFCKKEVVISVVCVTALCINISYILYELVFKRFSIILSERIKLIVFFLLGIWYVMLLCYHIAVEYGNEILTDYWYHQLKYIDSLYMYGGFIVFLSFSFAVWKNTKDSLISKNINKNKKESLTL